MANKEMEIKLISRDRISLTRLAQTKKMVIPIIGENVA